MQNLEISKKSIQWSWLGLYIRTILLNRFATRAYDKKFSDECRKLSKVELKIFYDELQYLRRLYNKLHHPDWAVNMPISIQIKKANESAQIFKSINNSDLGYILS